MTDKDSIPPHDDQRRHPRYASDAPVEVFDRSDGKLLGRLLNLSAEGLMVLSQVPVTPDRIYRLRLQMTLDGALATVDLGADCLWCNPKERHNHYWSGFQIIDIADRDRTRLLNAVQHP